MKFSKLLNGIFIAFAVAGIIQTSSLALQNDARSQYEMGIQYSQAGMYKEAAKCFKQAVEYDPNYIDAYYNLGSILEYLEQDDLALTVFKQIILRRPDDYESVYKAAQLSNRLGMPDKAKMYLTLIPPESSMSTHAKRLTDEINAKEKENAQIAQTPKEPENISVTPENFGNTVHVQANSGSEDKSLVNNQPNIQNAKDEVNTSTLSDIVYNNIPSPTGIVTDSDGIIYVAGFSDNIIYKIGNDNKKIVYIKSEKIDGPIGITMDSDKNLYVANYNKDNVLKISSNGLVTKFIESVDKPYCMHISNGYLYVSSQGSNAVIKRKLQ